MPSNPAFIVRLRPLGPWRSGTETGDRTRVDTMFHSDSVYAAVCSAMDRLGALDAWLDATARRADGPAVWFSSLYPFLRDIDYVIPPRSLWPPPPALVGASTIRWKGVRFVPVKMVRKLLAGADLPRGGWEIDGLSQCLVPAGSHGPFRTSFRTGAAVDRLSGAGDRHVTACLEFNGDAGLWAVAVFADAAAAAEWDSRVRAAFRILADSGMGGERSRGWGRSADPEFEDVAFPAVFLPEERMQAREKPPAEAAPMKAPAIAAEPAAEAQPEAAETVPEAAPPVEVASVMEESAADVQPEASAAAPDLEPPAEAASAAEEPAAESPAAAAPEIEPAPEAEPPAEPETAPSEADVAGQYWLLSLYSPAAADSVDWGRGNYELTVRGGRTESRAGHGLVKKTVRMIAEGSVLSAPGAPRGGAPDVKPDGFPHPVYRAGFAVGVPLPGGRS